MYVRLPPEAIPYRFRGTNPSVVPGVDLSARGRPNCGRWHPVGTALSSALDNDPERCGTPGDQVARLLRAAFFGVLAFKLLQATFDEDFGNGEFPGRFRHELIDHHVARHGHRCPECGSRVRRADLTVDHIVPLTGGGRTSRANAAVLCRWCNSSKGAAICLLDLVRGRSM